jgi:hypothetical protein
MQEGGMQIAKKERRSERGLKGTLHFFSVFSSYIQGTAGRA